MAGTLRATSSTSVSTVRPISPRRRTLLSIRSRLTLHEVEQLCRLPQATISMRGVSRVTGHHQATIARYYRLIGEHAALLTATFLQDLGPYRVEMDLLTYHFQL